MNNNCEDDAICCVITDKRQKETVFTILNEYLRGYEKLNGDYEAPKLDSSFIFENEDDMIDYFAKNKDEERTFHWNKDENNPDNIMLGAIFTSDGYLVISITVPANGKENQYLSDLKESLESEIGVISYNLLPYFLDGNDFINRYS